MSKHKGIDMKIKVSKGNALELSQEITKILDMIYLGGYTPESTKAFIFEAVNQYLVGDFTEHVLCSKKVDMSRIIEKPIRYERPIDRPKPTPNPLKEKYQPTSCFQTSFEPKLPIRGKLSTILSARFQCPSCEKTLRLDCEIQEKE